MSGQQIGSAVGFVAGFFLPGGPAVWSAIGGMIGGWIAPTQVNGPHIGDGASQSSAEGQPIPWIIGTSGWIQGQIVDKSPRREVKKTDDGKGSGQEVNTFEAHQDFVILICESSEHRESLMVGPLIVKMDGKIVYDMRPDKNFGKENAKFLKNHTFYNGNESQMPDPTCEAFPQNGVGNTPYYRGVYTMVARDINLTQYGDRIPVYEFVMVGAGEQETVTVTSFVAPEYGRFVTADWPLADDEDHYRYTAFWALPSGGAITSGTFDTIAECRAWFESETGGAAGDIYVGWTANTQGNAGGVAGNNTSGHPVKSSLVAAQPDVTDFHSLVLLYQWVNPESWEDVQPTDGMCFVAADWTGAWNGSVMKVMTWDEAQAASLQVFDNCGDPLFVAGYYPFCISVTRRAAPPPPATGDPCLLGRPVLLPDVDGFQIDCAGNVTPVAGYEEVSGDFWALQVESVVGVGDDTKYVKFTVGPVMDIDDPNDTEEFWTAAYDAAVLAGTMPPGLAYSTNYPEMMHTAYRQSYSTTSVTGDTVGLDTAITRICKRGGLTVDDIDVSEMDQQLMGYGILQPYNGADSIRPLMTAFTCYGSEYDAQLHFHKHGEAIEIVVNPDDFIVGSDETDKNTREQEIEYPRLFSVTAIDPTQDYTARPQVERRITPDIHAIGEEQMQVPVVLPPDQHRQLAAIGMKVAWARAQGSREFSVPYATDSATYLKLVAGKPFALDGKRLIAANVRLEDGEIHYEAKYDRQSAYTSDVTATPALPPTTPPSSIGGVTLFAGMNLPRLRSKDSSPGMYIAVDGLLDSWPGCALQMSIDDEATWTTAIGSMTQASTMGYLTAPIDDQPASTLSVAVHGGTLDSITDARLADGGNASAVITAGVSEVLQFQDSDETDPDKYDLTDLARGGLGTTAAAHAQGDRFVQLDSVYFLPLDISLAGRTIKFRPVTFGTPPESNAVYAVTFNPLFTGPQIVEPYVNESGEQYVNESGSIYLKVIS